jgi:hypothetical protein
MKYKCEMVRDLMPLCVDDVASETSKKIVVEHIAECKECVDYYSKMVNEIPLHTEYSEENKGYIEIARKIRKRKILIRTTLTIVICLTFIFLLNYSSGYRFTAEAAASLSGRLNISSELIGNYDWGDSQFYIYNNVTSYDVVTVNSHWNGWKAVDNCLVWPKYNEDTGGIINTGSMYYWSDRNSKCGIQLFPVIVKDSNVARIEISTFGKTRSIEAETNELTIITFENDNRSLTNEVTGSAYDSSGNVLYQLVDSKTTMRLVWEKVNK